MGDRMLVCVRMAAGLLLVLLCTLLAQAKGNSDGLNDVSNCHMYFSSTNSKTGWFSSPQYPRDYASDLLCRYTFSGRGKERVQITFMDLNLEYPIDLASEPTDCSEVDSLTVNINVNGEPTDLGLYCGSKLPPMLMSNEPHMSVIFNTIKGGARQGARGFNASFSFVTDFGIHSGKQDPNTVCGFTFNSTKAPNGTFTSPNHPGLYPKSTECHYLFFGKKNERVHLTFAYFDVDGIPPSCSDDTESDYIEFSNFRVPDRKMTRYCDIQKPPSMFKSDGEFFRVTFRSNAVFDATGFEAIYQFIQNVEIISTKSHHGNGAPALHMQGSLIVILLTLAHLLTR